MNYKRSLRSGVVPKGLRLKKKACLGEVSQQFDVGWEEVLKDAELKLVGLLQEEVGRKREALVERYEGRWSIVGSEKDEEYKKNLLARIEEKGQHVREHLEKRRTRKWLNLDASQRKKPRLLDTSIARLRMVLEEAEIHNEGREYVSSAPEVGSIFEGKVVTRGEEVIDVQEEYCLREDRTDNAPEHEHEQRRELNDNLECGTAFVSRNVVNLSDRVLTHSEIKVLSKGLNFCPTPKEINRFELIKDISEFGRKMKCRAYFSQFGGSEQKRSERETRFKAKSSWVPDKVDPALELFLRNLEERALSLKEEGNNYSNLDKEERHALKNLKSYRDIVIKEADKGSAVVVWGIKEYCSEAYNQLSDSSVYELVDTNPIGEVTTIIDEKLKSLRDKGTITEENRKYLRGKNNKLGRFYLLPKIHKRLVNVPGRPVISNCGTATEGVSEFVDFHLQPIVRTLPHIIKDTTDFLAKLENLGDIPEGAIICTMDVVGLYPHIPHEEGLLYMKETIEEFVDKFKLEVPVDLVEIAKLILQNNYFEFDDKIYRQKLGTAIGTKFAPSFANIFMSKLETSMLSECRLSPWVWWRFLDDIFLIWLHGNEALIEFVNYVNSYHDTIKYTWELSENKLPFLDVLVKLENKKISTDLYCKPTDTRQYLDNRSCHPRHVKQGIPYGQALRVRRICDSDEVFERRMKELAGDFVKRGFKNKLVDSQFLKAKAKSRESLLCQENNNNKKQQSFKRMPLVVKFHPALSGLGKIVESLWPILHASEDMKKVFVERPMVAYRRPRNLKDDLVRSKVKRQNNTDNGMRKCGKSRCQICKFVDEGCTFEGQGRTFIINFVFDCDSAGVIYLITCETCRKIYVGSTITPFRKRFNNHKSSLNRYGKGQRGIAGEHLYAHFFEVGHRGLEDVRVKVIDKTDLNEPTNREGFWAYKLNSFMPQGLNLRDFV